MSEKATRLYPLPALQVAADAIYEDLELPPAERREVHRPYVIINMVASLDGRVAFDGKSARIGSPVDRETMRNLRRKADAVMIGANTLRAEKLSLGLDEPTDMTQPIAIIVTGSGDLSLDTNLIIGERQQVLVVSPLGVAAPPVVGRAVGREEVRDIDFGEALKVLKTEHAVELLLVEGGPSLSHTLISGNRADELFLTLAPKLLGGSPITVLDGEILAPEVSATRLLSAYLAGDEMFLRYDLRTL